MEYMTTPSRTRASFCKRSPIQVVWGCAGAITLVLGAMGGCNAPPISTPHLFRDAGSSTKALDPARTPYHGWDAVDQGVINGSLEELVIARAIGREGVHTRTYSLRTLQGNPGTLTVVRKDVGLGIDPSGGLVIECSIRHSGDKQAEQRVLDAIRRAMIEQHRIEHED